MSSDTTYETYYVPHNSALPFFASLGIFLTVFGAGNIMNEMSSGTESSFGEIVFMMGGLVMAATLFFCRLQHVFRSLLHPRRGSNGRSSLSHIF